MASAHSSRSLTRPETGGNCSGFCFHILIGLLYVEQQLEWAVGWSSSDKNAFRNDGKKCVGFMGDSQVR